MSSIPSAKDILLNPAGFPTTGSNPTIVDLGIYKNVMYGVNDVVSDWTGFTDYLTKNKPDLKPSVLLISHDMTEIENITLMALGSVVNALNGKASYLLVNPDNTDKIDSMIESTASEWIGFNLYTGMTEYIFEWIHDYKLRKAAELFNRTFTNFEEADKAIKELLRENNGLPIYEGDRLVYSPIIIGGHFNNNDYKNSFDRGADFSVRGKGVNLLADVLMGRFQPGVYHDPISYPNLPEFDREGFYRDTFAFSDATKKYALSPVKSVLTALGCAYNCTYCYIGELRQSQEEAYEGLGVTPPSIIQDRNLETVLNEGIAIKRLDGHYEVTTQTVFDQADISLNNINWWDRLRPLWMEQVGIPFYIQARPAMLARKAGRRRVEMIAKDDFVIGVSMAIESGDEQVRKLLLKRMEPNSVILEAIANVKEFSIPIRTQVITGLPVMRPEEKPDLDLGLIGLDGEEHYYEDPVQESLKALELISESGSFMKPDYYWNSLFSPFPGTPLGNYAIEAGFHDEQSHTEESAYMFTSNSGLSCFTPEMLQRQLSFHRTVNFFAHLSVGAEMMTKFIYSPRNSEQADFAEFIDVNKTHLIANDESSDSGLMADNSAALLHQFFDIAYDSDDPQDQQFKQINIKLIPYYQSLFDGLILAAKMAERYFANKSNGDEFTLEDQNKVERQHYYDNSYCMNYVPETFTEFLSPNVREIRMKPAKFIKKSSDEQVVSELSELRQS